MQKIIIDAHDSQFKSRLNAFVFASAHILTMDLTDEAALDLIETISDALIEALHEESDYQAQIGVDTSPILGYSVRNVRTKTLPIAEIYKTPEEAQAWIDTIYPDRSSSLEVVEIKAVTP